MTKEEAKRRCCRAAAVLMECSHEDTFLDDREERAMSKEDEERMRTAWIELSQELHRRGEGSR